jgi:2-oxoglutarate ferredoxin oxidoreductase subunit beta
MSEFDRDVLKHWCPGCGNFSALRMMQESLAEEGYIPNDIVIVTGIGQAGKFSHFLRSNAYNGLHGRYLSAALAIKASNPKLEVIAFSGDGCTLSEGGNHFLHTIRYNPNIVNLISNNGVYGLTKGQASPTSGLGFITKTQTFGVINEPFNSPAVAISLNASFVARAFVGDIEETKAIFKQALQHKGYALIDLLSPCVSFNKVNTFQWYKQNSYYLDDSHDSLDREDAMKVALDMKKLALGIIYKNPLRPTYEENIRLYDKDPRPLHERELDKKKLEELVNTFR